MDENITLEFSEKVPICQVLEDFIPDDATCISVKLNIPDYDLSDNNYVVPYWTDIKNYLKDSGVEILCASSGIHINGKKQIPHVHYHIIANHYNEPSNPSQHRKRWLAKADNKTCSFGDASFKYQTLEQNKPKYQFLSYPLKEGIVLQSRYYIYDGKNMTKEMKDFLMSVGKSIYEKNVALHLRQEKCQERKQLAFKELCDLVGDRSFSSFTDMCDWFDENYLFKLDYDELPDPKNYKTNIKKIGIKKRLIRTRDI